MSVILTLNAGSSSLKFSAYRVGDDDPERALAGQVERLGPAARMIIKGTDEAKELGATDHKGALAQILTALENHIGPAKVTAVGHRIVHGGTDFVAPTKLTPEVLEKLRVLTPLAPLHQPHNLACVDAAISAFPDAIQIGCFDTAFHRTHPWVNDTFALPREYYDEGIRRYGFHGLSYDYITSYLAQTYPDLAKGRVVIAHLGNGASLCAVRNGQSVASTMGFSALDGLPMGTRSGQLDPGVMLYLLDQKGMSSSQISDLLYRQSGLLGLSGVSSDMRTLEASDAPEAAEAIDYFVFRITREIGAMAASLGGIDGLVFCGGIGENSAYIRTRVTENLGFLGVSCDQDMNKNGQERIGDGHVAVLAIKTNEEIVIARACLQALK